MIKYPHRAGLILGSAMFCILAAAFACGTEPNQAAPENVSAGPMIQILLDTSAAMEGDFDGETKIEAAVAVINELAADLPDPSLDQLALRQYGGACDRSNTSLVFPFGQQDENALQNLLENITVAGETTLGAGIDATAIDFIGLDQPGEFRRAIIVAGAGDSCQANLPEQLGRLSELGIQFTFIGMNIPDAQQEELNVAATAAGGQIIHVRTRRELQDVLSTIISELTEGRGGFSSITPASPTAEPATTSTATPQTPVATGNIAATLNPVNPISPTEPVPLATPTPEPTMSLEQEEIVPTPNPTAIATPTPTTAFTLVPTPTTAFTLVPTPTPLPTPTAVATVTPTPLPTLAPLVLTLVATPEEGVVPLNVNFTATASGQVAEYRWDFDGDGSVDMTTLTNTAAHPFQNPGTFNSKVTALDSQALTTTEATTVIVCSSQIFVSANILPQFLAGTVMIDGQNAPDGTPVVARVGCETLGETTVSDGKYTILVSQAQVPSYIGKPIEFIVGGATADQTATPEIGGVEINNLTVSTAN